MYRDKRTSTLNNKNQDMMIAEKENPKATGNIEQNKTCVLTRAKDNLSKKKKRVYVVEEKRSFLAF
jgi:hypothetical protein